MNRPPRRSFVFGVLMLIAGTLSGIGATSQNVPSTEQLIRDSHFIFEGQVEKREASNLKILPASPRTAVVRVVSVVYADPGMMDFSNMEITVQCTRNNNMKAGEKAVFFTNGWLYGEHLAVTETGHLPLQNRAVLTRSIADVHKRLADGALLARLNQATAVITGRVVSVEPMTPQPGVRAAFSEHDPEWWQARVAVESVLKGVVAEKQVTVTFPHSNDVMWFRAPKFYPGDSGAWLLHATDRLQAGATLQAPTYTALAPLDFQSASSSMQLQTLIRGKR